MIETAHKCYDKVKTKQEKKNVGWSHQICSLEKAILRNYTKFTESVSLFW